MTEGRDEDRVLLGLLADGEFHSGESLAAQLGISRAAIWKRIAGIEALGLGVERRSGRGYRLCRGIELLDPHRIRDALPEELRTHVARIDVHGVVTSTNDVLLQELRSGAAPHAVVCLAERQTSGRGRRGRGWMSPYGSSIYLSLAWRFERDVGALEGLSLATGIAAVQALAQCGVGGVGLKWPNDLFAGGAKLGGILIELDGELSGPVTAVIGIGINLRLPREAAATIDQPWTDLETLAGHAVGRNELVAALISSCFTLLPRFALHGLSAVHEDWQRLDLLRGRSVTVTRGDGRVLRGVADGVDAGGALRLLCDEGLLLLSGGEVSVRREA